MNDSAQALFDRAAERGAREGLPYAGAVTPPEAWQLLQQGAAQMVDVRTAPEYKFVGHVPGTVNVEWRGSGAALPEFLEQLRAAAASERPLLLLCRSAGRSHAAAAAATAAGFERVYNVLEGFEGKLDAERRRGFIDGWRRHGLPWEQD
ncbi:MAG: rhodanese-like domain-containing protein [Methylotetracoccus sp.]|nr:rhodanese-like domain-containing protein [Methylotetracoccus sp.]